MKNRMEERVIKKVRIGDRKRQSKRVRILHGKNFLKEGDSEAENFHFIFF